MDEDDDFFDMRSRFKMPEKRQKRPLGQDEESNSDSSSSDDSDSEVDVPTRPQPRLVGRSTAGSSKSNVIMLDSDLDSDSDEDETPQITPVTERKRPRSLTPPPVLGPAALQQAMQVVADHMNHKRTRNRSYATGSPTLEEEDDASSDFNDDFDISAYESKLKSDIAQEATKLKQREQARTEQQKIMLVLKGRSDGDRSLSEEWEKPLGVNVFSTIALSRIRDQFKEKRPCDGEIILACKGVQLRHGTPKDVGLTDQTRIDVYTEKSWKFYEDQRKRSEQRAQRKEEDVVSLSSEDEVKPPPAKVISITLQGPGQKLKLRVAETATIRTLAGVYREKLKIPSNQKITIALDGDPLMEIATVKTLDVDDGDVLDVQIDDA